MSTSEQILTAMNWRMACRCYDPEKHISDKDWQTILEAARLTPSSFGLEPWRLLVIENKELQEKIFEVSRGLPRNADKYVIYLSRRDMTVKGQHVQHMYRDIFGVEGEALERREGIFSRFTEGELHGDADTMMAWSIKQDYIMMGTMLTTAALMNIDSTPVEGFDSAALHELLQREGVLDTDEFQIAVMACFGYRQDDVETPAKIRQDMHDIVTVVK